MMATKTHYDVFISSKSEDYPFAEEVYDFLEANGIHCFLACRELDKIGEAQYANAIDDALDCSEHMIVVASSAEHIKSKWVQAEWGTFVNDLRSNYRNGNLVNILCGDIQLRDLPPRLRHQQTFPFETFREHILAYIGNHKTVGDNAASAVEPANAKFGESEQRHAPNIIDPERSLESFNGIVSAFTAKKEFLMRVEDVFKLEGRGMVVTGTIDRGVIHVGDNVEIVGARGLRQSAIHGIEMNRKLHDSASKGDAVGLLLREDLTVKRGDCIAASGTISAHDCFMAEIYMLKKEEGGGRSLNSYATYEFAFGPDRVMGNASVRVVVSPGSTGVAEIALKRGTAMEIGMPVAIRDNGRTIGGGVVKSIIR